MFYSAFNISSTVYNVSGAHWTILTCLTCVLRDWRDYFSSRQVIDPSSEKATKMSKKMRLWRWVINYAIFFSQTTWSWREPPAEACYSITKVTRCRFLSFKIRENSGYLNNRPFNIITFKTLINERLLYLTFNYIYFKTEQDIKKY